MTPNPFPGINPFIEDYWNDFGSALVNRFVESLNGSGPGALPADLRASIRRRDVLAYPADRARMPRCWIEVVRCVPDGEAYTAIEILNPVEKRPGDGRVQFWRYQEEYKARGVSRVVFDLLRGGQRPVEHGDDQLPPNLRRRAFSVTVHRGYQPDRADVYPLSLRERLPKFPIPLRRDEPDAVVDLQAMVDDVYRTGRYPIAYGEPCDPPLDPDDAAWAAGLTGGGPA